MLKILLLFAAIATAALSPVAGEPTLKKKGRGGGGGSVVYVQRPSHPVYISAPAPVHPPPVKPIFVPVPFPKPVFVPAPPPKPRPVIVPVPKPYPVYVQAPAQHPPPHPKHPPPHPCGC